MRGIVMLWPQMTLDLNTETMASFLCTPYYLPGLNSGRYQYPLEKLIFRFYYNYLYKSLGRYVERPLDPSTFSVFHNCHRLFGLRSSPSTVLGHQALMKTIATEYKKGFSFISVEESTPWTPRPRKSGNGRYKFQNITERLLVAILYL
jgi:hypothetical protein